MKKLIIILLSTLLFAGSTYAYTVKSGDYPYKLWGNQWKTELAKYGITDPTKLPVGLKVFLSNFMIGANPLPTDNYDTFITAPLSATASTTYVNAIPTGVTESVYTIFANDGTTPREKIYCVGVTTTPSKALTGCVRGVSMSPSGGVITENAGTGLTHSKNARIAITDTINFSGKAIAILNGSQATGANDLYIGTSNANGIRIHNGTSNYISNLGLPTSDLTNYAATVGFVASTSYAGTVDANTTAKGIVQEATQSQILTGTVTGTTGARLFLPSAQIVTSSNGTATYAGKIVVLRSDGNIDNSLCGNGGSCAQLDVNQKVLQNPTSATSTPTANSIPITTASGTMNTNWLPNIKFGGDGTNGSLSISSGTTTINVGSANLYILNYDTLSITGTGNLKFSNPSASGTLVIIKVKNDVTITCSNAPCIELSGMGATSTQNSFNILDENIHYGADGQLNGTASGGTQYSNRNFYTIYAWSLYSKGYYLTPGSGGGNGRAGGTGGSSGGAGGGSRFSAGASAQTNNVGESASSFLAGGSGGGCNSNIGSGSSVGGAGGGALLIEVGGYLNFTGTIWAKGQNGQSNTSDCKSGAGGGAGGMVGIIYNNLTSNSGSIVNSGGNGGNSNQQSGGTGGNSYSLITTNTFFF